MLRADGRVTSPLWNPLTSESSEDFNNFNSSQIAKKGCQSILMLPHIRKRSSNAPVPEQEMC
jgi:hypothetical protein